MARRSGAVGWILFFLGLQLIVAVCGFMRLESTTREFKKQIQDELWTTQDLLCQIIEGPGQTKPVNKDLVWRKLRRPESSVAR